MATEKTTITDQLRNNIITLRKELGISAYDLSEKSGHSKYWLPNIESGKTQKISKDDLFSIYTILLNDDDPQSVFYYIEKIINQNLYGVKEWDQLIPIDERFKEMYEQEDLDNAFSELLEEFNDQISSTINGYSVQTKQAALTAMLNANRTLYMVPDLIFPLLYVPLYGTKPNDPKSYGATVDDLLAIGAKYRDLVVKNDSLELIDQYREWDREQLEVNKKTAATALENFKSILELICSLADNPNPKLHSVRNLFYSSIAYLFNEIEPKTVGSFLPYLPNVKTGEEFSDLVSKTYNWFKIHQKEWALPNIQEYIPDDTYASAKEVLKKIPDVRLR